MIQANELRIGNLVETPDGFQGITEIQTEFFYTKDFKSSWAELKPIPLTEEWLERFGFEREEGRWTWKKNIYNEETTLPTSLQLWSGNDFISVCRAGIGAMHCPCEYVHQLQNLYYSLTGTELPTSP